MRLATMLIALAALGACAGRDARPVAISQAQDGTASCRAILAEQQANSQQISNLGSEKGAKVAQNVAAGVVGLFIWPVWFAMDFKGAASQEQDALEQRNQYLSQLYAEKCT